MKKQKTSGATLKHIITAIERIAPPDLAEEWDNTGLILGPSRSTRIRRALITIDCTPEVVEEAINHRCECVVTYHPPIFAPLTRLAPDCPGDRRLIRLIESRIAVYAPHTALDAVEGGINDWLAAGVLGQDKGSVCTLPDSPGRLVVLDKGISPSAFIKRVKTFLKAPYMRVAQPAGKRRPIRKIALCAGAGGSALETTDADVYLTGEMKHHDILAANARGITVLLSEHTHTERGYLPILKRRLNREIGQAVEVLISRADRDPITLSR